jgi:hypothetical protein
LPILRIVSGLSVDIEIHFINAGLPLVTWLGVPRPRAQLDIVELLHGQGNARHRRPLVPVARQYYYSLRTDSRRHSVGLTFAPQHEGKAAWVVPS